MNESRSFELPDLGEGLTEADLSAWMVRVGDRVELNQIIAEVETVKAAVELPTPYAGVVLQLLADEGQTVNVGSPIIVIQTDSAAPGSSTRDATEDSSGHVEEKVPVLVGYGVADESASRRRGRAQAPADPASMQPAASRPQAKPPVRKLARDRGIDLADVVGTGPGGRITRDDVVARYEPIEALGVAESDDMPAVTPNFGAGRETRTAIRGVRKHTAQAMVRSAFTAPHVTEFLTVDVTKSVETLALLKASKAFHGIKLTPLALVGKALLAALRRNPTLNSHWDDESQEIAIKHFVNLGIAAATPRGLVVPNIKDADRLGLRDIAIELAKLTDTAKEGKTSPADMAGGTITITNVGVFGVDSGTPILNPGEAAILCFGAIRKQPWVVDDEIVVRSVTTLSLSFDHRLVDGRQGSEFLADIASMLEDPLNLIAYA